MDQSLEPRLHPSERRDALRFVSEHAADAFCARQRGARERVALMDAFYLRYPCRMAALHRLAATGIAVTRFAGISESFAVIGELLMPVDRDLRPRTPMWEAYVEAFRTGRPAEVREECWIRAHMADMEEVKAQGWVARFEEEHAAHPDDLLWDRLSEHVQVTLGTRLRDREALSGEIALETAISSSLGRVLRAQLRTVLSLVQSHVLAAVRATVIGGPWVPPDLPGDRRLVCTLVRSTLGLVGVRRVWRLGTRREERGAERPDGAWSLEPSLTRVLGDEVETLHPAVRRLFAAMHEFEMTASVRLYHRLGRSVAWMAALLVGQGMYEEELDEVPARFRLFRRADGSLHFVREFWCAEEVRVFDSDFVVRRVDGRDTLLEVFTDLGLAARMRTEVLDDGGLSMTVVGLFVRGLPVGVGPAHVCFESRADGEEVVISGVLDVRRSGVLGRLLRGVLRLPERVGEIRYRAVQR